MLRFSRFARRERKEGVQPGRNSRATFIVSLGLRGCDANVVRPMSKEREYVQNAVESLELAERLPCSSDRRRMLRLAEAWVEVANQAYGRKGPRRQAVEEFPSKPDEARVKSGAGLKH
jgi:hypothetical protein